MKMKLLFFASAILVLTSCSMSSQNENKQTTEAPTEQVAAPTDSVAITGTFEGTLPAADCEGIFTTLTINADKTYKLVSKYLGRNDADVETNGVFNVVGESVIELVTPSSGDKTYYKVLDDGNVMLSDENGTINDGPLADKYILKKK